MEIDHIFIFTDNPHAAAEELLALGLSEGSSRVHPGQGTANRKFYFENFFLEILWVQNEAEITSPALLPIKLWQRTRYLDFQASPYGLCLLNTPDTAATFTAAIAYQPAYFPAGLVIDVLPQEQNLSLPWTFRLPFRGDKTTPAEPMHHRLGLQRLTQAIFGLQHHDGADAFLQQVANQPQIRFASAPENALTLIFDENRQGETKRLESLNLTIRY